LKYGERDATDVKFVVALTGCSGIAYGVRLMKVLEGEKALIISPTGKDILSYETGLTAEELARDAAAYYEDSDLFAPLASGSHPFRAMIIAPCSESTLAKIACGTADTLITRTAAVALKEHRRLILATRETPVSAIMLENELKLARLGVTILPASPGFYHHPRTVDDLVDFVVGKILDQVGQEHALFERWKGR
jgi:4-hydroxy-3-polyprenylbenzoate decarboxylase